MRPQPVVSAAAESAPTFETCQTAGGQPELSTYRHGGEARQTAGADAATAVASASTLRNTTLITQHAARL